MGKGKGKVQCWYIKIKPGTFLFEFINLRNGRARYFMKQMQFKLYIKSRIYFLNTKFVSSPYYAAKKARLNFYWC
uniref:Ribosomal protein L16 n=1 Tax=Pseudourostyla cristata TaxID=293816 RepID=A0A4V1HFN2_9SPIT|nr:ribosomal protein L16 [Pseudourostyla cristata]